mmetsp:Transcript_20850/g.35762  ORF Transcript_20850/g.35762 Transcript_20850/m.35762 type:complete len:128 (+) Transcript_20850:253-636(+)
MRTNTNLAHVQEGNTTRSANFKSMSEELIFMDDVNGTIEVSQIWKHCGKHGLIFNTGPFGNWNHNAFPRIFRDYPWASPSHVIAIAISFDEIIVHFATIYAPSNNDMIASPSMVSAISIERKSASKI